MDGITEWLVESLLASSKARQKNPQKPPQRWPSQTELPCFQGNCSQFCAILSSFGLLFVLLGGWRAAQWKGDRKPWLQVVRVVQYQGPMASTWDSYVAWQKTNFMLQVDFNFQFVELKGPACCPVLLSRALLMYMYAWLFLCMKILAPFFFMSWKMTGHDSKGQDMNSFWSVVFLKLS